MRFKAKQGSPPPKQPGRKRGRTLGDHVHLVFRGLTGELLFRQARLANLGPIWGQFGFGPDQVQARYTLVSLPTRVECGV